MENRKINILGTEYRIETRKISEDETMKKNQWSGYCDENEKLIVVADMTEKEFVDIDSEESQEQYRNRTLRHEIMHAFLNESGLSDSSNQYGGAWAKNEEMVDWFAIQSPKIFKAYSELGILDMPVPSIPPLQTGFFTNLDMTENFKCISDAARRVGLLNE